MNPSKEGSFFGGFILVNFDIIFLQETYSDPGLEEVWRAEWGAWLQTQ